MRRVQLTLDEKSLAYLEAMVKSGDAASLSHAVRKIIARVMREEMGAMDPDLKAVEDLADLLCREGYSSRATQAILEWYRPPADASAEDPAAWLRCVAEETLARLGSRFQVEVKANYHAFPLTLTITVEYKEEASEDALPEDQNLP